MLSTSPWIRTPFSPDYHWVIFARYLNTSESTIEKWETGAKKPSGMALKLLSIVRKHGLKMLA
jgi:DNA-binding transcriptional regulator YiaG